MVSSSILDLDVDAEIDRIAKALRNTLAQSLRRRGLVVAISGGIDSAVCSALAVRAIGPDRVFGLLLPERDSQSSSTSRGRMMVEQLGIRHELHDIAPALDALGCYSRRDAAIRTVIPAYTDAWQSKIAITGGRDGTFSHFKIIARSPAGEMVEQRLDLAAYLEIVAATSFKQRVRKVIEYFHADRLHYAVVGTPNRLEYDQGFFVKNGDGAADVKPIAHLYKTQVYMLAEKLGVPKEIRSAAPSTDTYSLVQGQDEFYFGLPYQQMDIALAMLNRGEPAPALAKELGIDAAAAEMIYNDIRSKRRTTAPLHWPALLLTPVEGPATTPPKPAA